jgi:uncharacterized protein with gpF-like domain
MTLRPAETAAAIAARRNRILREAETRVETAVAAALRDFLRRIRSTLTVDALTAAAAEPPPMTPHLFTLAQASGWWSDAIDQHVTAAVAGVWRAGYVDTRDGALVRSSLQSAETYLANVVDRLSRTATPTIPQQAFDIARVAIADEIGRGSSTQAMSQRLAAEFGWDNDATFWRGRLDDVTDRLDRVLDGYGPPGSQARLDVQRGIVHDGTVKQLQDQRADAVQRIDRVESTWQTRSERIARTESTGAYNAGALDAGIVEEAGVKVWMATGDDRTRDDHLAAHGECVPMSDRFDVGGTLLEMPGDPSGPPEQVINCRCTIVFARSCGDAADRYGFADRPIDDERAKRDVADPERPPQVDPPE